MSAQTLEHARNSFYECRGNTEDPLYMPSLVYLAANQKRLEHPLIFERRFGCQEQRYCWEAIAEQSVAVCSCDQLRAIGVPTKPYDAPSSSNRLKVVAINAGDRVHIRPEGAPEYATAIKASLVVAEKKQFGLLIEQWPYVIRTSARPGRMHKVYLLDALSSKLSSGGDVLIAAQTNSGDPMTVCAIQGIGVGETPSINLWLAPGFQKFTPKDYATHCC